MDNLPIIVPVLMIMATVAAVLFFYRAAHRSGPTLAVLLLWLALQSAAGLLGFYTFTEGIPPRFALLLLPALVFIIAMFLTRQGRRYIDQLDIHVLTLLHIVRIPVEIVLWALFMHNAVPEIMTFEGRNLDVLSGITAPVIYILCTRNLLHRHMLLVWNVCCLALLVNIVVIAILSGPFAFQRFAFDRPNIALLYFPYIWLPCCVVPLVLLSHLAAIRQLVMRKK